MTDVSPTNKQPTQWVSDVNETLDYLQDDVAKALANDKVLKMAVLGIGIIAVGESFLVMQMMKAIRNLSAAVGQLQQFAIGSVPQEVVPTNGAVMKPVVIEQTEVPSDTSKPVVQGSGEAPEWVKQANETDDSSMLLKEPAHELEE